MVGRDGEDPTIHQAQRSAAPRLCPRRGRHSRRRRRNGVQALRLRPERGGQPLARDRRRALRPGLLARIDQIPRRQEIGGHADLAGRGRPCAADAASDPADHRTGQSLLRLSRRRSDRIPPGRRRQSRAAPGSAGTRRRSRASLARAFARSPIPNSGLASPRSPRNWPEPRAGRRSSRRRPSPNPSRSGVNSPMKLTHILAASVAILASAAACNAEKGSEAAATRPRRSSRSRRRTMAIGARWSAKPPRAASSWATPTRR